ncbi:MAG: YbjN domain-containing protein [Saprospiraceae bacterium]|nr:YbjN domain-containing protein [Saprospiraceae bacterium]
MNSSWAKSFGHASTMQGSTSNLLGFYRRLLELNDEKLGIKRCLIPNSPRLWASFDRDIQGLDFNELTTFIRDFEHWVDKLDDELKAQFPHLN